MKKVTLNTLVSALKKKNYDASIQTETDQVFVLLKIENLEFPLFIRVLSEGTLIQQLTFFPFNIKKEAVSDLSRFLHLVNKELDIPGFGMDETAGVVFFRCMVPISEDKLPERIFFSYLHAIELIGKNFSGAIGAVATGEVTFDDILKKSSEMAQKPPKDK